jgi:hypothetical protein
MDKGRRNSGKRSQSPARVAKVARPNVLGQRDDVAFGTVDERGEPPPPLMRDNDDHARPVAVLGSATCALSLVKLPTRVLKHSSAVHARAQLNQLWIWHRVGFPEENDREGTRSACDQYSSGSITVSTRTVMAGSAGSGDAAVRLRS